MGFPSDHTVPPRFALDAACLAHWSAVPGAVAAYESSSSLALIRALETTVHAKTSDISNILQ